MFPLALDTCLEAQLKHYTQPAGWPQHAQGPCPTPALASHGARFAQYPHVLNTSACANSSSNSVPPELTWSHFVLHPLSSSQLSNYLPCLGGPRATHLKSPEPRLTPAPANHDWGCPRAASQWTPELTPTPIPAACKSHRHTHFAQGFLLYKTTLSRPRNEAAP